MNPVVKVAIAVTFVASILWWAIGEFLGGTDDLVESLDVRSLSHLRDSDNSQTSVTLSTDDVDTKSTAPRSADSVTVERNAIKNDSGAEVGSPVNEDDTTASPDDAAQDSDAVADLAEEDATQTLELAGDAIDDSSEETEAEARARRLKEKLGIKEPKPPTRAVDVELVLSSECDGSGVAMAPVSVKFRFESPTIRGASLNQLEILVAEFRDCPDSIFQLTENVLGKVDATPALTQMRFDELKYFFIQHSVPKSALRYPESS